MTATYVKADDEIVKFVGHCMDLFHWRLRSAGVTVSVLMATAPTGEDGETKGPALKVRGHACLAKIRIVGLRDRVEGMADAELMIDGDRWVLLDQQERAALVDHELTHLNLVLDKHARPKRDAAGRPKLRARNHDVEVGWFVEVAERHGKKSQEQQQARQIVERETSTLYPFLALNEAKPVDEKARAA